MTTYRKNTITLVTIAVHLDVVVTPLFDLFYGKVALHGPCKHRIQQEYQL